MTRKYTWTPEGREARRAANARTHTPEVRAAKAEIMRARWQDPEWRARTVAALREARARDTRVGVRSLQGSQRYQYRLSRDCGVPHDEALRAAREIRP